MTDKIISGAGGGGCFRKGSQVQLEHGKTIAIEELKVGDKILSFDEQGRLEVDEVEEVCYHAEPQPILRVNYWRGEFFPTPNHWVLNQYSAFAEMSTMTIHDALVDGMGHLRPIIGAELIGYEPVWNLKVKKHHTFIVDGIRVHNGGHRDRYPVISGAGGGGAKGAGGSGHTPEEAADSLHSIASLALIDLIGEGEIGGLVNGAKSIFLNDTPLQGSNDEYNFAGVSWAQRTGTQSQTVIPGYSDVETPHSLNVAITKDTPQVFTITNPNVDRVRVIINVNSLMHQNKSNGDIGGSKVEYNFSISTNGGAFVQIGDNVLIKGKTKSRYQRSTVLDLPKPGTTWTVKITRVTKDAGSVAVQNSITLDSYIEIIDSKLSYPNSALVAAKIDPKSFANIPRRAYHVKGLYIQVPSNYDAETRTYTGIWDGTFKVAISNNPAWVLYDLLSNNRYGLGEHLTPGQIDKAGLYKIGQYCDEMLDNGKGGTEPRFVINTAIQTQAEAYKLVSDITAVFRGMAYWNGGMVGFAQDSPTNPTMVFSQANVVDGVFNYTSSSRKDRHSVIYVKWTDPAMRFKQRVEYVEDPELILSLGIKPLETVAFGCTSQAQAHRVGRWILYTEKYESNVITFKAGLDASLLIPGEVVKIHDQFKAGKRMSGRLTAVTATSATLDAPVTLSSAGAILSIKMPDGTFTDVTVKESAGTFTTLTWLTALGTLPVNNAIYLVSEINLQPMLARVISVAQSKGEQVFEVTCVEHNPSKYAEIENGIKIDIPQTSIIDPLSGTPKNFAFQESTYFVAPGVIGIKLSVSWEGQAAKFIFSYRNSLVIDVTEPDANSNWVTKEVLTPSYEITDLVPGMIVDVKVQGVNTFGIISTALIGTYTIVGKTTPPAPPTALTAMGGERSIQLSWVDPSDIDLDHIDIWENSLNNSATATKVASVSAGAKTYTRAGLGSGQTRYYWLKAVNTWGTASDFNATNGVSAITIIDVVDIVTQLQDSVSEDALTQDLLDRINQIDILAEADLTHVRDFYDIISAVKKSVDDTTALIKTEQAVRADQDGALASQITTLLAISDQNAAAIQTEATTRANQDGAIATQITTLQSQTNSNTAAVQTEATARTTADGLLNAQWTVKVNANGYIAGMGVAVSGGASGPISSSIIMLADKFAVVQPGASAGAPQTVPFVVGTVDGVSTVAISNAMIQDAAISNAKIGNVIQSTNWNATTHTGWKIDKAGNIEASSIVIRDASGNIVLSSGQYQWSAITGTGKPADNATVGAPAGTLVGGVDASNIATAVNNFNASNDRNSAAITAPTILSDGTAIDHVTQANGSVDISFEWAWTGSEGDIDGFQVFIYQAATNAAYTFGTTPAAETIYTIPASKRAFILFGTAPNAFYTFGVRAYRSVDKDINSAGVILSALVKPSLAAENPYQPSTSVAFNGNVTGTINGISAANVNVWSAISGTGKPADNATVGGTLGVNIDGQITPSNSSTFISDLAVGSLHLAVNSIAKIHTAYVLSATTVGGVLTQIASLTYTSTIPITRGRHILVIYSSDGELNLRQILISLTSGSYNESISPYSSASNSDSRARSGNGTLFIPANLGATDGSVTISVSVKTNTAGTESGIRLQVLETLA